MNSFSAWAEENVWLVLNLMAIIFLLVTALRVTKARFSVWIFSLIILVMAFFWGGAVFGQVWFSAFASRPAGLISQFYETALRKSAILYAAAVAAVPGMPAAIIISAFAIYLDKLRERYFELSAATITKIGFIFKIILSLIAIVVTFTAVVFAADIASDIAKAEFSVANRFSFYAMALIMALFGWRAFKKPNGNFSDAVFCGLLLCASLIATWQILFAVCAVVVISQAMLLAEHGEEEGRVSFTGLILNFSRWLGTRAGEGEEEFDEVSVDILPDTPDDI
ncbi:MAG: hypothetical protein LBS21_05955 [Clostridiales bacterium]|jgi:hypothetical protein|nr:hypothetical protein [Clostridiales bacterium]